MLIIHEAVVGPYKFTICKDWLAITKDGKELVHLNEQEKGEVIPWLFGELGINTLPTGPIHVNRDYPGLGHPVTAKEAPSRNSKIVDMRPINPPDFSDRRATSTSPVMVGNPDLANSAPDSSADGKQKIFEVGVTDLAAVARKGPQFGP